MSGHPGQVTSPPVSDAVPGELSHDEHQEDDFETNDPDHDHDLEHMKVWKIKFKITF